MKCSRRAGTLAPAVLVALTTLLAGCSAGESDAQSSPTTTESAAPTGTITLWDASDAPHTTAEAYAPIIEAFRVEYPGVEVQVVEVGQAEAREKFAQASLDRAAPALLVAPSEWTVELAGSGFLEPLTGTPLETSLADYVRVSRPSVEFDNILWALPQTASSDALVCNQRLLSSAGASVPGTWEEVPAAAAAVQAVGATLLLAPASGAEALPYLYSQGGGMLDVEASQILVNNAASVAGWDTSVALIAAGNTPRTLPSATDAATQSSPVPPDEPSTPAEPSPPADTPTSAEAPTPAEGEPTPPVEVPAPTTAAEARDAFLNSKLACVIVDPASTVELYAGAKAATDISISINPLPAGSSDGAATAEGTTVAVAAAVAPEQKELAYLFAQHLNSTESQLQLARDSMWSPARGDSYQLLADDSSSTSKVLNEFAPLLETAQPWPPTPELAELIPALDFGWAIMATGTQPPQQTADAIAAQWRTVLPATYRD